MKSRLLSLISVGLIVGSTQSIHGAEARPLADRSPFLSTAEATPTPAPDPSQALQLRGVVEENHQLLFSIYDPATKRSVWVAQGQATRAFAVQNYDVKTGALQVVHQGRMVSLALKEAPLDISDASVAVANLTTPAPPKTKVPVTPQMAPLAEQRRLAPLVEEIRRRQAQLQSQSRG